MLHTDAAQQRPGNLPASAPEASQPKPPRAQEQAHPGRPAAQRRKSQLGNTTAADRTAGTMGTSHISVIHDGPAQPPPWNSTPHALTQTLQKVLDLTKIGRVQHERSAQLARYHPLGEGHEQARSEHKEKPDNTQATTTAQYTHSTLVKSSNRPMAAARRRQGQQLEAWHGTPSRRPQAAPPFPLTPAGEVIQPPPPALPLEAWPSECNTNKAKHPKRDKVFLNTTHC